MIRTIINNIEKWAEAHGVGEAEIRRAVRMVLPSYKLTRDTEYGPYNRNGYQRCRFEVYNGNERYSVHFYEYSSFHDENRNRGIGVY